MEIVTATAIDEGSAITVADLLKIKELLDRPEPRITHWEAGQKKWDFINGLIEEANEKAVQSYSRYGVTIKLNASLPAHALIPVFQEQP